jgi:hypothetical protein
VSSKPEDSKWAKQRVSDMQEAELLKFLRETTTSLVAAVERLEALAEQREDPYAG